MHAHRFKVLDAFAAFDLLKDFVEFLWVLRREQHGQRSPDRLVGAIPVQAFRRRIPAGNHPAQVARANRIVTTVDDRLEKTEPGLQSLALLDVAQDDHRAQGLAGAVKDRRRRKGDVNQFAFPRLPQGVEGFNGPKTEGQRVLDKSRGPLGPYIANSAGTVPDFAFTSMGSSFKPKFKNGYFGFGVNAELTGGPTGQQTSKLRQVNQLERPGQIALFATCAQINTFQAPASGKNPMLEEFYFFNTTDCANTIHFRHAGNAIIAFADGSQREVSGNRASFNSRLPSACVGRLPATMILP